MWKELKRYQLPEKSKLWLKRKKEKKQGFRTLWWQRNLYESLLNASLCSAIIPILQTVSMLLLPAFTPTQHSADRQGSCQLALLLLRILQVAVKNDKTAVKFHCPAAWKSEKQQRPWSYSLGRMNKMGVGGEQPGGYMRIGNIKRQKASFLFQQPERVVGL